MFILICYFRKVKQNAIDSDVWTLDAFSHCREHARDHTLPDRAEKVFGGEQRFN